MFKLSLWGDFYYLFQNKSKAFFNFIQDEQTNPQNAFKELDYLDKNKQVWDQALKYTLILFVAGDVLLDICWRNVSWWWGGEAEMLHVIEFNF